MSCHFCGDELLMVLAAFPILQQTWTRIRAKLHPKG